MRRYGLLVAIIVIGISAMAQQPAGLSPKAGAFSSDLYSNIYFGFNLKIPEKWNVVWVAETGNCGKLCMLLDVRDPEYTKSKEAIQITAEDAAGHSAGHESSSGAFLVQAGAKRLDSRDVQAGGITFYRTDYRSNLADGTLYQSMLVLPGKEYTAVFTFTSMNRRDLDGMVAAFPNMFSKTGAQ